MRAEVLEQVFVKRAAGAYELLLVLESAAGSRERVNLTAPGQDEGAAMRFLAAYLRQEGLGISRRARVRRHRGQGLEEAPDLLERLRSISGTGSQPEGGSGRWD